MCVGYDAYIGRSSSYKMMISGNSIDFAREYYICWKDLKFTRSNKLVDAGSPGAALSYCHPSYFRTWGAVLSISIGDDRMT